MGMGVALAQPQAWALPQKAQLRGPSWDSTLEHQLEEAQLPGLPPPPLAATIPTPNTLWGRLFLALLSTSHRGNEGPSNVPSAAFPSTTLLLPPIKSPQPA